MSTTPSTEQIVAKHSQKWSSQHKYRNPKSASGKCYISTTALLSYYDNPEGLEVAFARHHNDPQGRYYEHGQYSNHYAIWHLEEKLVVDFTLTQFAPTSQWPWVGTYSAWLRILARAWGVQSAKHLTRSRGQLCSACATVNCNLYDCPAEEELY